MRRFRIYKANATIYIQEYQQTLFGMMWHVLVSFPMECETECKAVVKLLNKCNEKSQDNDTR
ncbi:MAG: hypothetical protein IJM58_07085 [Muribaculaceae bacterium]|nr:hypothetical protein [Muribaculaceae bacterium]